MELYKASSFEVCQLNSICDCKCRSCCMRMQVSLSHRPKLRRGREHKPWAPSKVALPRV